MDSASAIRGRSAVASFDATNKIAEYGFTVADPRALAAAKTVVDGIVTDADSRISKHFETMGLIDQNPYADFDTVNGRQVTFAAVIQLFEQGDLERRVDAAFSDEGVPRPDLSRLTGKAARSIAELAKTHGYEVAGSQLHGDCGIALIALRDPVYVQDVLKQRTQQSAIADETMDGKQAVSATDMGIESLGHPNDVGAARQVLNDWLDEAITIIVTQLTALSNNGDSPFGSGGVTARREYAQVVDQAKVQWTHNEGHGTYTVARGLSIDVGNNLDIDRRTDGHVQPGFAFDRVRVMEHLQRRLTERLKATPELKAGVVAVTHSGSFGGRHMSSIQVLCGPDHKPKAPGRTTRLLAWLGLAKQPVLALPAPAPIQVPPIKWDPAQMLGKTTDS